MNLTDRGRLAPGDENTSVAPGRRPWRQAREIVGARERRARHAG